MVTNAEAPEQKPGNREVAVEAVARAVDGSGRQFRYVVTGDPQGPTRRRVLFLVAAIGILLGVPSIPAIVSGVALLLLALTDTVVEV